MTKNKSSLHLNKVTLWGWFDWSAAVANEPDVTSAVIAHTSLISLFTLAATPSALADFPLTRLALFVRASRSEIS